MIDPMGQAIQDYLEQPDENAIIHVATELIGNEDLPVSYLFRTFDECPITEQTALKACRGKVLDIGAGAGSHSLWLQENGVEVTALEISGQSVNAMKNRGLKNVVHGDLFNYQGETYDTILLLMNGIGLAGQLGEMPNFLEKLKTLLNPNGQILAESADYLHDMLDEDGNPAIDLEGHYYGEVQYQMSYNNQQGKPFDWLYLSYGLLKDYAEASDLNCTLLDEGEDGEFLVRLVDKNFV